MAATRSEIDKWFDEGIAKGATHMIVVCDTFDHEDYPVFVKPDEDAAAIAKGYDGREMQRVMEVYKLTADKAEQLAAHRVYNL